MLLIEKLYQHHKDFTGLYKCENCGEKEEHPGYDDDNFNINVVPNWKCRKCGKSSKDMGISKKVKTKYPAGKVV